MNKVTVAKRKDIVSDAVQKIMTECAFYTEGRGHANNNVPLVWYRTEGVIRHKEQRCWVAFWQDRIGDLERVCFSDVAYGGDSARALEAAKARREAEIAVLHVCMEAHGRSVDRTVITVCK